MIIYIFSSLKNLRRITLVILFTVYYFSDYTFAVQIQEGEGVTLLENCDFKTKGTDQMVNLQAILSSVHSFEEYEILQSTGQFLN